MLRFLDNLRARITNAGYGSQNRTISLVSSWLANTLWLIESRFLNLAKETYSQNEVVYACLRLLSQSVPEAPLTPYADAEKKKALDAAHPLVQLIKCPNELMTEYEFWELTTLHMAIVGRSTWWKERNNAGQVIGLWPLRPDRVGPRYSDSDKEGERVLWGYNYQVPGTGVIVPIPRRDVIAFNFPDPAGESGGIVEGIGPVMALARQVASDNEATKFVGALLANYAAPTVAVKIKGKVRTEDEANLIKSHFRSQFGGANRGVPAVVDADSEIQVIGFNLRELEFPEIREIAESRIAAALGVPAVLAGLRVGLMRSTFNNMTESRRFFTETTLSNYWRRFQDQYTLDIAAEFDENIVCEFDTSKVKALAGALLELAQPVVDAFKVGVAMVNDYRAALKMELLDPEYGEVLYIPNTVTVVPVTDKAKAAIEKRQAALPKPEPVPQLPAPKEGEEGEQIIDDVSPLEASKALAAKGAGHAGHRGSHAGHDGSSQSKQTAREAVEAIRHEKKEYGVAYDKDGNVLFKTEEGGENSIPLNTEQRKLMRGATFVHNHPSSSSFSAGDVLVAERNGVSEMRVVSSKYDYALSVDSPKQWKKLGATYTTTNSRMVNKALEDVRSGKRTLADVNANIGHEVMTAVATKVGAKYTRTEVQ